ncbi:hypothetical protein FLJC2902T_07720 [Flavobacterium limnosediminis JC2902]|uniref:Uncharacterized protein n=1 Tax=Flavobacterium limnosediminis JC2902 TaxID=1341181 RepID=V6SY84_9FLAO|nr:hypothetical protein [Flavobacterium limnosediminis]ESU29375.1 hypothetical protein FLJC2902T_07720 [Flavobacterium limnosediminis JC2902]
MYIIPLWVILHLFKNEYESHDDGTVKIKGLEKHKPLSNHKFAGRKLATN